MSESQQQTKFIADGPNEEKCMSRPLTEGWAACRAQTREEELPRDKHQKEVVVNPGDW